MVKIGVFTETFKHSWEEVAAGFFQKYPNPYSTHVLTADTVLRQMGNNNTMFSRRLLTKTSKKPKWMERWIDSSTVFVVEDVTVQPQAKTMTTFTRNITLTKYMSVEEKSVYTPSPENPEWTQVKTEARVISSVAIAPMVERFGIERFKHNFKKAAQGLIHVIEQQRQPSQPTSS